MARGLQLLEPFGEGNPKIKFKECINSLEFTQMGSTTHAHSDVPSYINAFYASSAAFINISALGQKYRRSFKSLDYL